MENKLKDSYNLPVQKFKKEIINIEYYKNAFKENYTSTKEELINITSSLNTYKSDISKMTSFLETIYSFEENSKKIDYKFTQLHDMIDLSIEMEKKINLLSTNQQLTNISEYVSIYENIKKIYSFILKTKLKNKEEFLLSLKYLMTKGFRIFEDSFYNILNRYNKLENGNEKQNSLSKIKSLAECLSDERFDYHFTSRLVNERTEYIISKINHKKISISKTLTIQSELNEKGKSLFSVMIYEVIILIKQEKEYIYSILDSCSISIKQSCYSLIIDRAIILLKDMLLEATKQNLSISLFFNFLDLLNSWEEALKNEFIEYVSTYSSNTYNLFNGVIEKINDIEREYIKKFLSDIETLNEKLENENILQLTTKMIYFISKITILDFIFTSKTANLVYFTVNSYVKDYITILENKSVVFDKTYSPLRWIFLINNIFFIYQKIKTNQNLLKKYSESEGIIGSLYEKIISYIDSYTLSCWGKVSDEIRNVKWEVKENGKTLKSNIKENVKKVFSLINETLNKHCKIQKYLKIIDSLLEKEIISKSSLFIKSEYNSFMEKYNAYKEMDENNVISEKYVNLSGVEIENEIKLFFSSYLINKK